MAGQTQDKRQAILDAATRVFAEKGFVGANMDEVVAEAAVSKQTLYKHFRDKAQLFREIVVAIGDRVDSTFVEPPDAETVDDVEAWVRGLALRFTEAVMDPSVQRIRRLVIAEAPRFPDMAALYWERGFVRVLGSVAEHFAALTDRGLLDAPDSELAAHHFAGLLLWIPSNRVMFSGASGSLGRDELAAWADAGARVFLAAYARKA